MVLPELFQILTVFVFPKTFADVLVLAVSRTLLNAFISQCLELNFVVYFHITICTATNTPFFVIEAYCARFFSLVSTFPNFVMHCSRYKDIKFSSFFSQHMKSTYFLGYPALFLSLSDLSDYNAEFNSYSFFK